MIRHIVFLVNRQDFPALKILTLYLVEQECIRALLDIAENRFR